MDHECDVSRAEFEALRERVRKLEPPDDDAIRAAVADLEWTVELADTAERRATLVDVAVALREQRVLRRSEARRIAREDRDLGLGDASLGKLLSQLGRLRWVDAGGQGGQRFEWIGG